jgi:hypothetical protein
MVQTVSVKHVKPAHTTLWERKKQQAQNIEGFYSQEILYKTKGVSKRAVCKVDYIEYDSPQCNPYKKIGRPRVSFEILFRG